MAGEDPQFCLQEAYYFRISTPRAREIDFNTRLYVRAVEHQGRYLQSSLKQAESRRSLSPHTAVVMGLRGVRMVVIWVGGARLYWGREEPE